ncbi:hypothetical protein DID78_02555 [Candidatus Marinamargulisbacteria bacterium SCGC AG-343-D04]|nr:hypothetical protein DID78_02555 [Candidatus Marinamargulisbacteria bacterium SCGC AG-343-D04]
MLCCRTPNTVNPVVSIKDRLIKIIDETKVKVKVKGEITPKTLARELNVRSEDMKDAYPHFKRVSHDQLKDDLFIKIRDNTSSSSSGSSCCDSEVDNCCVCNCNNNTLIRSFEEEVDLGNKYFDKFDKVIFSDQTEVNIKAQRHTKVFFEHKMAFIRQLNDEEFRLDNVLLNVFHDDPQEAQTQKDKLNSLFSIEGFVSGRFEKMKQIRESVSYDFSSLNAPEDFSSYFRKEVSSDRLTPASSDVPRGRVVNLQPRASSIQVRPTLGRTEQHPISISCLSMFNCCNYDDTNHE